VVFQLLINKTTHYVRNIQKENRETKA
jgi:hypothetical protein